MRLGLPYQFGWLHYTKLVNNEQQHPGLGVSVYYGAPHTKTTIYVYNNQLEAIDGRASPNLLNAEFDDATVDLINANPQATLLNERRQENSCFKSFNIGTAYSAIALSTIKDHFFKIRITVDETTNGYVYECMMESLTAMMEFAREDQILFQDGE